MAGDGERSVDGLIAFLASLFPHLPEAEALGYLDAVGPDPLVAALVIIGRRRMLEFGFDSATTRATVEAALRFALSQRSPPSTRTRSCSCSGGSALQLTSRSWPAYQSPIPTTTLQVVQCA